MENQQINKTTTLAIIIPYFKIAFFEDTLKSIEKQTSKKFHLYIGNDASPNDPSEVIKKVLQNTYYKYIDYTDNMGAQSLSKQWDRLLDEIHDEDWFLILGDDDVLADNFVEIFHKNIQSIDNEKTNVIKVKQRWIDKSNIPITNFTQYPRLIDPFKRINGRASLSEHIFRTSVYKKIGFKDFPLAWKTDNLAVMEFSTGNPIYFLNQTYVNIRISEYSISGQEEKDVDKKKKAVIFYEKYIIKNYHKKIEKQYLKELLINQIHYKYKYNIPLEINLIKLYLYLGEYRKIITLPKVLFQIMVKNKSI